MPYFNARDQDPVPQNVPDPSVRNFPSQMWDVLRSGAAGFKQGLWGKDMTFEQWQREQRRRRQGMAPGSYPSRNWLQRVIRGR